MPTDADDPDKRDTSGRSGKGNYNNQQPRQQSQTQQQKPQPPKDVKLTMPKDANEAWKMVLPSLYAKHQGKTLGKVWQEDQPYIAQILSHDKAPVELVEGITIIQVAMAEKAAKEKQGV